MTDGLVGRTVVVTGGDGFIGRHVVDALRTVGAEVRPLVRPGGSETTSVDLRDAGGVRRQLEGADLVVHLAARAGGVQFQEASGAELLHDNTRMTENVLASSLEVGVARVFLASSAVVYAADAGENISEGAPVVAPGREPVSPYAWSKLTDEVRGGWFRDDDMEVVVGRFTNVFGAGASFDPDRSTVIHALVKKAMEARPDGVLHVWGDGSAVRDFIHVRDAASAVRTILERGAAGHRYNVSAIGPVDIATIAETVRRLVDPRLALRFDASAPTGAPRRALDATALAGLGFAPAVDLESGIRDVIAAFEG